MEESDKNAFQYLQRKCGKKMEGIECTKLSVEEKCKMFAVKN